MTWLCLWVKTMTLPYLWLFSSAEVHSLWQAQSLYKNNKKQLSEKLMGLVERDSWDQAKWVEYVPQGQPVYL